MLIISKKKVIGMDYQEVKELIFDSDREVYMETIYTHLFNDIWVGMSEKEISTFGLIHLLLYASRDKKSEWKIFPL